MHRSLASIASTLAVTFFLSASASAQTVHTVQLDGTVFLPRDITIQVGDTVHWEWVSGFHNVESGTIVTGNGIPDGNFRSGDPTGTVGTTYDLSFSQAFLDAHSMSGNVYPYYCVVHTGLNMAGTVTVTTPECTTDADCGDGNVCNGTETCQSGSCVAGTGLSCSDGNACTDDTCNPATGCRHVTDDSNPCDDGDACTENDACVSGVCVGLPSAACCQTNADCDDGNDCTDDTCQADGQCVNTANDTNTCDDGNACTVGDVCLEGTCTGTPTMDACCVMDGDCDDGDDCTSDSCVDNVCVHTTLDGCTPPDGSGPTSTPSLCGALGMVSWTLMFVSLGCARLSLRPVRHRQHREGASRPMHRG